MHVSMPVRPQMITNLSFGLTMYPASSINCLALSFQIAGTVITQSKSEALRFWLCSLNSVSSVSFRWWRMCVITSNKKNCLPFKAEIFWFLWISWGRESIMHKLASKTYFDFTQIKLSFDWDETYSVDTVRWALNRPLCSLSLHVKHFSVSLGISKEIATHHRVWSRVHLTVSNEQVLFQTN